MALSDADVQKQVSFHFGGPHSNCVRECCVGVVREIWCVCAKHIKWHVLSQIDEQNIVGQMAPNHVARIIDKWFSGPPIGCCVFAGSIAMDLYVCVSVCWALSARVSYVILITRHIPRINSTSANRNLKQANAYFNTCVVWACISRTYA